jgi:hypothetical protein
MASQFFSSLLSGSITGPQSLINAGGPLPSIPSSAPAQYHAIPDGKINPPEQSRLLQGGLQDFIYAYGPNPSRLTTQTQMNIPNKIQLIIPKIFIPAAVSDGSVYQDPILEHAITDGDLVFSLKMNREMVGMGSQSYVIYPQGYTDRAVKLVNLATANYILWGLQVGANSMQGGSRWKTFFSHLCKSKVPSFSSDEGESEDNEKSMERIWNFIKTYLAVYGVQHGSDMQGGQHEGSKTRVVTTNATDYVASFAVEGKILKMNNLWRAHDINENDDLVLAMRYMPPQQSNLLFNLSSSNRSSRTERAPVNRGWWYLNPEVLEFKTIIDMPYIHVARSQKMISSFAQSSFGIDMPAWNARASIHGPPLQVTLEPGYMQSDKMWLRNTLSPCCRMRDPPVESNAPPQGATNSSAADEMDTGDNNNSNTASKAPFFAQHAYSASGGGKPKPKESLFASILQGPSNPQAGNKKRQNDEEDGHTTSNKQSAASGDPKAIKKKKTVSIAGSQQDDGAGAS